MDWTANPLKGDTSVLKHAPGWTVTVFKVCVCVCMCVFIIIMCAYYVCMCVHMWHMCVYIICVCGCICVTRVGMCYTSLLGCGAFHALVFILHDSQ